MSDLDHTQDWLQALKWDADGMIPAIAQDEKGRVVMFAYMNRDSLQETLRSGNAVYWSRSRKRLWRKGEESGHFQKIKAIRTDCFFNELNGDRWIPVDQVLKDPKDIYK